MRQHQWWPDAPTWHRLLWLLPWGVVAVALYPLLPVSVGSVAQGVAPGEYPRHIMMPKRPTRVADYESMWDPFALRLGPPEGTVLEIRPEAPSESRLMAPFDALPWNGRQITRDQAGNWLVLVQNPDTGSLFLATGPGKAQNPYRPRGGDLTAFELVGPGPGALFRLPGGGTRASMVVDDKQHLHVVFQRPDGLYHLRGDLGPYRPNWLRRTQDWTAPVRIVEGNCKLGDLLNTATEGVSLCYAKDDAIYYRLLSTQKSEKVVDGSTSLPRLRQFVVKENLPDDAAAPGLGKFQRAFGRIPLSECICQDPVMDQAPDGTVWLAFRRDFEVWVARRDPKGTWSRPERVAREYAFHPSIIVVHDRPLIVYHHDGLRRIPLDLKDDLTLRAGGASAIGYAVLEGDGWRTGTVVEPEEVVVHRRGMWAKRGTGRLFPQIEQLGWPVLFRDPRGVVWALWQNTTRRWSYSARWLGQSFGEVQECRGPFNAPRLPVHAEKFAPPNADDVGVLFHAAAAGGNNRVLFDRLHIPSLAVTDPRKVLFLDCLEVAETQDLELVLNTMKKPTQQPVLSPSEGSSIVYCSSIAKHGDTYVLGYRTSYEADGSPVKWAISKDGMHFQKVDQLPKDLPPPTKVSTRSLDYWYGDTRTRPPSYYPNPLATDPSRKFVRLGFSIEARGSYWLEYSPDGRQWTRDRALTAPEAMRERARPTFYDAHDPERPIRIYSRVYTETGRSWGVIWSQDLLHWSGLEHLLDPDDPYGKEPAMDRIGDTGKEYTMRGQIFLDAVAGNGEDEIYAASVCRAEGLYFCFYWPGKHGRPLTDVGIAVSRDGFHFTRVKNGQRVLPLGPPGAWDSGLIFQMHPLLEGDTVRVYYRGTAGRREGTDGYDHYLTEIGVATIRADGFTYYRPREGAQLGTLTTIPIQSPKGAARTLAVNLEGTAAPDAVFAVEVVDAATGKPVPGFARADCLPVRSDGLAVPISWHGGRQLPAGHDIRLRFNLSGRGLRLYGFEFR
ncbi:MAG: hypothetical protein NZ700_10025 [Gemmataceae bacterium]|nr:hypothetical protein [Gemmataceae bacterium]